MTENMVFAEFNKGRLLAGGVEKDFAALPWNPHPKFPGVALKHLVVGKDAGEKFSYHLVRIEPEKAIGLHTHDPQLETHEVIAGSGRCRNGTASIAYSPGVIAVFPPTVEHEVAAGDEGLLLFAKFMPPLC